MEIPSGKEAMETFTCDDILFQGYGRVWCVEAGVPLLESAVQAVEIITAFEN